MISWHRLFGIALTDLFADTAWEVILELDLSVKLQLLDIVIVRRGKGREPHSLPDGFGPLADHNLVTYKSLREPLDGWAIKELIGHSVNYRKQVSPSFDRLVPEESIRLFAICTRFPNKLASQVTFQQVGPGVYDLPWGTDLIRLLVLSEIPAAEPNAILNLFSADKSRVTYAAESLRSHRSEASTLLTELLNEYEIEGVPMPYTKKDFKRDVARGIVAEGPDEFVAALSDDLRRSLKKALERSETESKGKPSSTVKSRPSRREKKS